MTVCPLEDNGFCPRHRRKHVGHSVKIALEVSERAEKIRLAWDGNAPPATPLRPPSMLSRARAYAQALARHKSSGSIIVPTEVKAHRRALCDSCQYRNAEKDECTICGCVLHNTILGDKLAWATESCPKNKWPAWKGDDWKPGTEPALLSLNLSVQGMSQLNVSLPQLMLGEVQVWGGQGAAPIWGSSEEKKWFSPFDWSATVSRVNADGPERRFVLTLERYTPTSLIRIMASKLTLLSITPFLAVGQGILMPGDDGTAVTPCKPLVLAEWSVTITEDKP